MTKQITRQKIIQAYKNLFDSVDGKVVLADLLKMGHVLRSSYVQGQPYDTAFQEGERNLVLKVLSMLEYKDEDLARLSQDLKAYSLGGDYD